MMVPVSQAPAGESGFYPLTAVWAHEDPVVVLLTIEGETLETTPNHPFYTAVGEWVQAGSLQPGDKIRDAAWGTGTVEAITFLATPQVMYNFTVATAHTYFVGDGQWLVHNENCWKFNPAVDLDWQGTGKGIGDALDEAFARTGVPRGEFEVTRWGYSAEGKSFPVEWRVNSGPNRGAEVSVDLAHVNNGPQVPHVGYQSPGKRGSGGAVRGHILLDDVPYNR